jgi:hypothetical protein
MNGLLTPLAVLGLILFVVLVVLLATLFFEQAVPVWRLLRGARVSVGLARTSTRSDTQDRSLEARTRPQVSDGSPTGWGFDGREFRRNDDG